MVRKITQTAHLEENLTQLKGIVERMEEKNLPLDQALKEFEAGIQLVRNSQKILTDAEQKISILLSKAGTPELEPFDETSS